MSGEGRPVHPPRRRGGGQAPPGRTFLVLQHKRKFGGKWHAGCEGDRCTDRAGNPGRALHFFSFEDTGSNRKLSESEIAAFQEKYATAPGMNTLWKILAEMSRMGIIHGFIAFNEYQMAQKREQTGRDPFGIVPGGATTIDTLYSRLENILYSISIDTAQRADDLEAEAKKYEELQKMIQLITGA